MLAPLPPLPAVLELPALPGEPALLVCAPAAPAVAPSDDALFPELQAFSGNARTSAAVSEPHAIRATGIQQD